MNEPEQLEFKIVDDCLVLPEVGTEPEVDEA